MSQSTSLARERGEEKESFGTHRMNRTLVEREYRRGEATAIDKSQDAYSGGMKYQSMRRRMGRRVTVTMNEAPASSRLYGRWRWKRWVSTTVLHALRFAGGTWNTLASKRTLALS